MHWKQLKGSHKFAAHKHTLSRVQSIVRPVPALSAKRPLNTVALVANWTIGGTVGPVRESGNWRNVGEGLGVEVSNRKRKLPTALTLDGLSPLFQAIILANFLWRFSYQAEIKCDELRVWLAVFKELDMMVIKWKLWQKSLNNDRECIRYYWLLKRYYRKSNVFTNKYLFV